MINPDYNNNAFNQFGPVRPEPVAIDFGGAMSVGENAFEKKEYALLPDGNYAFSVRDVAINDYGGSAKLPPCKCMSISIDIVGSNNTVGYCRYNIYLVSTNARRLRDFLACVGKIAPDTHNFTLAPSLLDVAGLTGRAHFSHRDYNGKTYQDFRYALPAVDNQQQPLPF